MDNRFRDKTVRVNDVDIQVIDIRFFGGEPELTPARWCYLKNTNWAYQLPNSYDILKAAGHDINVIDLAVPQSWWDAEYNRWKKAPQACWSYEENKLFGAPLWWSKVLSEFEAELRKVWIAEGNQCQTD